MARCTYCQNETPGDAPICPYCGAQLALPRTGVAGPDTPVTLGGPTLKGYVLGVPAATAAAPAAAAPTTAPAPSETPAAPAAAAPVVPGRAPAAPAPSETPAAPAPDQETAAAPPVVATAPGKAAEAPGAVRTPAVVLSRSLIADAARDASAPALAPAPVRTAAPPGGATSPAAVRSAGPSAGAPSHAPAAGGDVGREAVRPASGAIDAPTPASEGGYPGVRRTSPGGLVPGLAPTASSGLSPRAMAASAARARSLAAAQEAAATAGAGRPRAAGATVETRYLVLAGVAVALVVAAGLAYAYFGTDLFTDEVSAADRADDAPRPKKKRSDDVAPRTAATATGPLFGTKPPESRTAPAEPPASLAGARSTWTGGIASGEEFYRSTLRMELTGKATGDVGLLIETEEFTGGAEEIPAGKDRCAITYRRPMTGTTDETSVTYRTVAGRPAENSCRPGTELAADTRDEVTCRLSGTRLDCAGTYKATLSWAP